MVVVTSLVRYVVETQYNWSPSATWLNPSWVTPVSETAVLILMFFYGTMQDRLGIKSLQDRIDLLPRRH